jgi:hypothetical protein
VEGQVVRDLTHRREGGQTADIGKFMRVGDDEASTVRDDGPGKLWQPDQGTLGVDVGVTSMNDGATILP